MWPRDALRELWFRGKIHAGINFEEEKPVWAPGAVRIGPSQQAGIV